MPWTCSFQHQLKSLGSILVVQPGTPCCRAASVIPPCPAAIRALVTIQTHKQSLSNQAPIHSWMKRVHMQVKCLSQGHSATLRRPRPVPKISQSKVAGRTHRATTTYMYMEYIFLDVGTLRVVTVRELVVFGGSSTCHSVLVQHRHSRCHARLERNTVSNVEGREINLHKPIPCSMRIEPEAAA